MKGILILASILVGCNLQAQTQMDLMPGAIFNFNPLCIADKMAYPVNHGSMEGYHDANYFQKTRKDFNEGHLGADINGIEQGNSDYGDTVYCIGKGKVIYLLKVNWYDGTQGSLIMILHKTKSGYIVSQYRHCLEPFVRFGQYVDYLQPISRIGNDAGTYMAHLHFEIRTNILKDIEYGYGNPAGYLDPIKFIRDYNENQGRNTGQITQTVLNKQNNSLFN